MKKYVALLLCLAMLCIAGVAYAANYAPGDTVKVTVRINSVGGANADIYVNADNDSVLIFQSASLSMGGLGMSLAPQKDGAAFALMSSDYISPLPTGTVGTVTYKISSNAAPGEYKIIVSSSNASVSGSVTVNIPAPECAHTWDEGTVTTEATCTKDGKTEEFRCLYCLELISGGEVNTERAAIMLLDEFRAGKIGNISLESPVSSKDIKENEDG